MSADKYPSIFSKSNGSNIFRNTRSFENWGIGSDIPLGNGRSRDAFRPIARERKYLMDYVTSAERSIIL